MHLTSSPAGVATSPARSAVTRSIPCLALALALAACATAGSPSQFAGNGPNGPNGSGDAGSPTTGSGASATFGDGSLGGSPNLGNGGGSVDDASSTDGPAQVCNDAGCTCIRIASIGHAGIFGACGVNGNDGTGAFETWLNTQSTATVDTYATAKPTLTPAFLAPYDVIILQWMRDIPDSGGEGPIWNFSPDEVSALTDWVNAGGGLISLSGYDGDGQEVTPLNTLLSFAGITYHMDSTYGGNCTGESCWGGACALTAWNTTSPIGAHLTQVGIANGRSISVATDAGFTPVVDCPCPGGNDCAVHEDIGKGHVFAFTDEWVTYTSQWLGTSPCTSASCVGMTAADDFQVAQFWYNAIRYASEAAKCGFTLSTPGVIPR
jgi:hypothetical protein